MLCWIHNTTVNWQHGEKGSGSGEGKMEREMTGCKKRKSGRGRKHPRGKILIRWKKCKESQELIRYHMRERKRKIVICTDRWRDRYTRSVQEQTWCGTISVSQTSEVAWTKYLQGSKKAFSGNSELETREQTQPRKRMCFFFFFLPYLVFRKSSFFSAAFKESK